MNAQESADLQERIMSFCKNLQRQHPDWMFARAFSQCQMEHPEWFKDAEAFQETMDDAQKEMQRQKEEVAQRQQSERLITFKGVAASANVKEMVGRSNQDLQQRIKDEAAKIQQAHPGMSFTTAYGILKAQHPGWFIPDDAVDKIEERGIEAHPLMPDKRAALAIELMNAHPGTTYPEALDHLKRTRPELFDAATELAGSRSGAQS